MKKSFIVLSVLGFISLFPIVAGFSVMAPATPTAIESITPSSSTYPLNPIMTPTSTSQNNSAPVIKPNTPIYPTSSHPVTRAPVSEPLTPIYLSPSK